MTATNACATCHECGVTYNYDPDYPHVCSAIVTGRAPGVVVDITGRGRADDPKHNKWQAEVRKIAVEAGFSPELHYHAYDSRKSTEGYPDEHLLNLNTCRSVYVECKVGGDKPSVMQMKWGMGLIRCGHEWYCLYPSDEEQWREIVKSKPAHQINHT